MNFLTWLWIIPVSPLVGATLNGVFGQRLSRRAVGGIAVVSVALSFVVSLGAFLEMLQRPEGEIPIVTDYFTWIRSGAFQASFGFLLDHLSGLMILVVTGVGLLIHIYSTGYMHDEPGYYRYFAYCRLGRRRLVFVFVDRVLVQPEIGGGRGQEGIHRQSRR